MTSTEIYSDIAKRTAGDIYIGVVGPVRTGKSTFIRKFMECAIIPMIDDEFESAKTRDELPQSAGGRTVMTTEPKFIPEKAVSVLVGDKVRLSAKMVDCVGYLVPDALGREENGELRMVNTPWSDEPIPFDKAATLGTEKVIRDHATIGMLVTTDGTICDIPRESYVEAEERAARELASLGKPYAVILNSANPEAPEAETLALELEKKYGAPVALVNCLELDRDDVCEILTMVAAEFPVREISVKYPGYISSLPDDHRLKAAIRDALGAARGDGQMKLSEATGKFPVRLASILSDGDDTSSAEVSDVFADMGSGNVTMTLTFPVSLYYKLIGETCGIDVKSDKELFLAISSLASAKREYDRISSAMDQVMECGYGIVMPDRSELVLKEPKLVRQAGGYGVLLSASAPSIHMIRADLETELSPIVGTEEQSEEMVRFMLEQMNDDPEKIWDFNMFGRSMYDLVNDSMRSKLKNMPPDARSKLSEALSRIICEGCSGLVCILL